MDIIGFLTVIGLLAFLVESLIEYLVGSLLFDHIPALHPWRWVQAYVAAAVGVAGAIILRFDLLFLAAQGLGLEWAQLAAPTIFGMVLTGLAIGRGSNYIHDIVANWFRKPGAEPQG